MKSEMLGCMIQDHLPDDAKPDAILAYTFDRIAEPFVERHGFEYRNLSKDILKTDGEFIFRVFYQPSVRNSRTRFIVHISVESEKLADWRRRKYNKYADDDRRIFTCMLAELTRRDIIDPWRRLETEAERIRCITEVIKQVSDYALPFFDRFKNIEQLISEIKNQGFLPHRLTKWKKKQIKLGGEKEYDDFIDCFTGEEADDGVTLPHERGFLKMKYYVVDAFTDEVFKGNPAGVCMLEGRLDTELMQNIAAENNLSETAFVSPADGGYDLCWFSPETEIDLCGHATLASAFVIHNFVGADADQITFFTKSGDLLVEYKEGLYELDFPSRPPVKIEVIADHEAAVGCDVLEAYCSRDLLLLVKDEAAVRNLVPNFDIMRRFSDSLGVIVTAKGDDADFVSRFFAPNTGVPEDPVTGSSHCTLIPFWAERLCKDTMTARQLSGRGGTLYCRDLGKRVKIAGRAVLYLEGAISI